MLKSLLLGGIGKGKRGNNSWMILTVIGTVFRIVKHLVGSETETVYKEKLKPGQSLIITHHKKTVGEE